MPKHVSKSGLIRSSLGPRKANLLRHLTESTALIQEIEDQPSTDVLPLTKLLQKCDKLIARLEANVSGIKQQEHEWNLLLASLPEEEIEAEVAVFEDTAKEYQFNLVEAEENICHLKIASKSFRTAKLAVAETYNSGDVAANRRRSVKLPTLNFPTYDGDVLMWTQFWSLFSSNIDATSLTGAEKLAYLRGQLRGKALSCIEGLETNDVNYPVSVSILKDRFQRTNDQIIASLYVALRKIPAAQSSKIWAIMHTYDESERIFRQLIAAGEDVDHNRSLSMEILAKYPAEVLTDLKSKHNVDTSSNVMKIREALKILVDKFSDLAVMLGELEPFNISKSPAGNSRSGKSMGTNESAGSPGLSSTFIAGEGDRVPSKPVPPCYFCGNLHFNSQCDRYSTIKQRRNRLIELKRCLKCLGSGHIEEECRSSPVKCFYCRKANAHTSAMCPTYFAEQTELKQHNMEPKSKQKATFNVPEGAVKTSSTSTALCIEERSLMSTAVSTISNPVTGTSCLARILFDSGSSRSYITEDMVRKLALRSTRSDNFSVAVFGTKRSLSVTSSQVEFELLQKNGNKSTIIANTTPIITNFSLAPETLPSATRKMIESLVFAMADDFNSGNRSPPDILLGTDYIWQFISGKPLPVEKQVFLIPTSLGFILGGRYSDIDRDSRQPSLLCLTERTVYSGVDIGLVNITTESKTTRAGPELEDYWSLEKIGILDDPIESDDSTALHQFHDSIYFEDGRYNVRWPWKDNKADLPTNYMLALGRLKSLSQRLAKTNHLIRSEYNKVISNQLELDIIERVPPDDLKSTENPVHYLAHHPVVKVGHATTKVRIVFDASARCGKGQVSLNETMYRGPVILPNLCAILIRFRLHNIAMISDIEKAFLQIGLQPKDRDVTRFLWFRDTDGLDVNMGVDTYRFMRVPFGVIRSPFLLGATIQFHLNRVGNDIAKQIVDNIYVDNCISGASTENEALAYYKDAKMILAAANMNLREWCTNSTAFLNAIPISDRASTRTVKILGLSWNSEEDLLSVNNDWKGRAECNTKRDVLKAAASIYDPLGWFQPVTMRAKCFLRRLWNNGLGWDDFIGEEACQVWIKLHTDVAPLFDIKIERLIPSHINDDANLVVFSDASADVYSTTVYLRLRDAISGKWKCNLVFAKSRLTPRQSTKKEITLPRLELLGLTIATKATEFVRKAIDQDRPLHAFILTDSSCVLGWVRSNKSLPTFVANRLKVIRAVSNADFHHVTSSDNPADLSTRGLTGLELRASTMWWHGPDWLSEDVIEWPTTDKFEAVTAQDLKLLEQASFLPSDHQTLLAQEGLKDDGQEFKNPTPFGIKLERYSSYRKLLRITGWCLRFLGRMIIDKLPAVTKQKPPLFGRAPVGSGKFLTTEELIEAKIMWTRWQQANRYGELSIALHNKRPHQLIHQLGIEIDDDGVLRCHGRLKYAHLPLDAIQPILLARDDPFTDLIVTEVHEAAFHSGINHTLNQIRRCFWIPHGRNVVRRRINRCLTCRKYKGPSFALPKMPPWPRERVAQSKPFEFTGVDYFGPVNVTINNEVVKMWVALFCCLATRAVHLEPVMDCSARCFIECISRFIARRGTPYQIISDNAPQFGLAKSLFNRTWSTVLRDDSVQSYISSKGIKWQNIIELAPWQGGMYERLVGVVKSTFKTIVGRKLLEWDQFQTLIVETEAIVNSRPITYVHSDIDSGLALRPMEFLIDQSTGTPQVDPTTKLEGGEASRLLLRTWKSKQRRLEQLWQHWYSEYLLSLRERGQTSHRNRRDAVKDFPMVDEVVLVKNDDAPRGMWKVAKVIRAIEGRDGLVRSAELLLPNKLTIRRPINHLYRLEVPNSPIQRSTAGAEATQHDSSEAASELDPDVFDGFVEDDVKQAQEMVSNAARGNNAATMAILIANGRRNTEGSLCSVEADPTLSF